MQDQLALHQQAPPQANSSARGPSGQNNGHGGQPRQATASQVRAIEVIAGKIQLDLTAWLHERYGLRLAPELSISLMFGSAIHRAIEHHFRELLAGNQLPDLDALQAVYQQEWAERKVAGHICFGKEESQHSLDGLAQRMLRAFAASDLAVPQGRILAIEEELRGNLIPGLPDILARIDLIVETPRELIVADWKTSRTRWNAEQVEESAPQLLLYSDLVRELAPGKSLRVEFAVLTKTKEVLVERHGFTVDPDQVTRTKGIVERVWRAIEAGHFYPAPSAMNCAPCPFREPCRQWPG